MNTRVESWDQKTRVLWLIFEGRGDALEANLRGYRVDYVPAPRTGWIGICYRPGMSDLDRNAFQQSTIEVIELLTARSGITAEQKRRFLVSLSLVQNYQCCFAEAAL